MEEIKQISEQLDHFLRTMPDHKGSNVYEIICEDRDGNITDRKFGVNVLTDSGFDTEIVRNFSSQYGDMYIIFGTGSGVPTRSDTALFERIPNSARISETCYNIFNGNGGQNYYDSSLNQLIGRRNTGRCVLDYNYSWLTEDVDITEFAEIRYTDNTEYMHTHALIYDENHDPSYFTKRMNEKVTISIYRAFVLDCSIIDTLWNEGKYVFINPQYAVRTPRTTGYDRNTNGNRYQDVPHRFMVCNGRCTAETDYPLYPAKVTSDMQSNWLSPIYALYNNGIGHPAWDRGQAWLGEEGVSEKFNVTFPDGGYRDTITYPEKIIDNKYNHKTSFSILHVHTMINEHYYGNGNWGRWGMKRGADRFYMIEKNKLETPEAVECEFCYTDDFMHPEFNNIFGVYHLYNKDTRFNLTTFPFDDIHITAMKRYNSLTHDYDIDETFTDDPDYEFTTPERFLFGNMTISGFSGTFDVFLNIHNHIPILGFNNQSTNIIYMTDKYWDPSTYVKLDHNDTVPAALQHKKYILKTPSQSPGSDSGVESYYSGGSNMVNGLYTIRQRNNHKLVPSAQNVEINLTTAITMADYSANSCRMVYSSDDGWVYCHGTIIFPDSDDGTGHPYQYTIDPRYIKLINFTHDHIITIAGDTWVRISENATVMWIFKVDATHPEIDPNTTVITHGMSDFRFGSTSTSTTFIRNWCTFLLDEPNNKMYINRGAKLLLLDLTNETLTPIEVDGSDSFIGGTCYVGIVYGTDYLIYFSGYNNDNTEYQFKLYNTSTGVIDYSFSIPIEGTMTLHFMNGYKNMIYIQMYRDSAYYLYMYNYITGALTANSGLCWNALYYSGDYIAKLSEAQPMMYYDNDVLFLSSYGSDGGNNGCRTILIFADDLDHPVYFDNYGGESFHTGYQRNYPRIKTLNNGTDRIMMFCGEYGGGRTSATYFYNVDFIKDHGWHTPAQLNANLPKPIYKMPCAPPSIGGPWYQYGDYSPGPAWFAEACFYGNKVMVFNSLTPSKPTLIPIEMFLSHKIIGTTKTITAYNNPKKLGTHTHGMALSNILP